MKIKKRIFFLLVLTTMSMPCWAQNNIVFFDNIAKLLPPGESFVFKIKKRSIDIFPDTSGNIKFTIEPSYQTTLQKLKLFLPTDTLLAKITLIKSVMGLTKKLFYNNGLIIGTHKGNIVDSAIAELIADPTIFLNSFSSAQCGNFFTVAGNILIQTGYFKNSDFQQLSFNEHSTGQVFVGNSWMYTDFDPGMPFGIFPYPASQSGYASIGDILADSLITISNYSAVNNNDTINEISNYSEILYGPLTVWPGLGYVDQQRTSDTFFIKIKTNHPMGIDLWSDKDLYFIGIHSEDSSDISNAVYALENQNISQQDFISIISSIFKIGEVMVEQIMNDSTVIFFHDNEKISSSSFSPQRGYEPHIKISGAGGVTTLKTPLILLSAQSDSKFTGYAHGDTIEYGYPYSIDWTGDQLWSSGNQAPEPDSIFQKTNLRFFSQFTASMAVNWEKISPFNTSLICVYENGGVIKNYELEFVDQVHTSIIPLNDDYNDDYNDYNIVPNPTTGKIFISPPYEGDVEIFSVIGESVSFFNMGHVDISHLPTGMYVIKLNNKIKKIIKI